MDNLEKALAIALIGLFAYFLIMLFILVPLKAEPSEIHGELSFGYIGEDQDYCTEFVLSYEFSIFVLQGGIETLMEQSPTMIFFCPYRNTYSFSCRIQPFEHLYVEASHQCTHAVWSYRKQFYDNFEGGNRTNFKIGIRW